MPILYPELLQLAAYSNDVANIFNFYSFKLILAISVFKTQLC